jgi:hypothetical protein
VKVGRREQKKEGKSRSTTDERVDTKASQEGKRMVSGSMAVGGIRVTASPSENGGTVNDEIASSDESSSQRLHNDHDKEGLMERGSRDMTTFALL